LRGHSHVIEAVKFAPNSISSNNGLYNGPQFLASASRDSTIRLWDIWNFDCVRIFEGHGNWVKSLAFFPDGRLMSTGDRSIRCWSLKDGSEELNIAGDHSVNTVAIHSILPIFATASSSTIKVWT
jgi:WD40 repeat protein